MNIEEIKDRVNLTKNAFHKLGIEGQVNINVMLNDIEFLLKEIERTNEILIWKQKHEEQLQKEIEELKQEKEYLNCIIESDKDNYINKDKIKAKIEELEKLDFGTDLVSQFTANLTTITILQSLLEKE